MDAKEALRQAAEDTDPVTRRAAMEAIGAVLGESGGGLLKQGLNDPNDEGVRFSAAMALGEVRYLPALPILREKAEMYTGERDKRVYCAVLYALYRMDDVSHLGDLAGMLIDERDPDVRAFAAQVFGKIGNPAAVSLLKKAQAVETSDRAKYNMTEALALLNDPPAEVLMESYARGYYIDLQLEAIPVLARQYSPDTVAILRELMELRFPTRVRVRAAGALARLGQPSPEAYTLCAEAARSPAKFPLDREPKDVVAAGEGVASLQTLAAISLGWMGRQDALEVLTPLLHSPSGTVRVAAAMSVIRLLPDRRPAPVVRPAAPVNRPAAPPRPTSLESSGAKD